MAASSSSTPLSSVLERTIQTFPPVDNEYRKLVDSSKSVIHVPSFRYTGELKKEIKDRLTHVAKQIQRNPILQYENQNAVEAVSRYYFNTKDSENEIQYNITEYALAYFSVWPYRLTEENEKRRRFFTNDFSPISGQFRGSSFLYITFFAMYASKKLNYGRTVQSAQLQDYLKDVLQGYSKGEITSLEQLKGSLVSNVDEAKIVISAINQAVRSNTSSEQYAYTAKLVEQLTILSNDNADYKHDYTLIMGWLTKPHGIDDNQGRPMDMWGSEIRDVVANKRSDEYLTASDVIMIRKRISELLEGDIAPRLKELNAVAMQETKNINLNRAVVAALTKLIEGEPSISETPRPQIRSKRSLTDISTPEMSKVSRTFAVDTQLSTTQIERYNSLHRRGRINELENIRTKTNASLLISLQQRRHLYAYINFPVLKTRELESLGDLPAFIRDLIVHLEESPDELHRKGQRFLMLDTAAENEEAKRITEILERLNNSTVPIEAELEQAVADDTSSIIPSDFTDAAIRDSLRIIDEGETQFTNIENMVLTQEHDVFATLEEQSHLSSILAGTYPEEHDVLQDVSRISKDTVSTKHARTKHLSSLRVNGVNISTRHNATTEESEVPVEFELEQTKQELEDFADDLAVAKANVLNSDDQFVPPKDRDALLATLDTASRERMVLLQLVGQAIGSMQQQQQRQLSTRQSSEELNRLVQEKDELSRRFKEQADELRRVSENRQTWETFGRQQNEQLKTIKATIDENARRIATLASDKATLEATLQTERNTYAKLQSDVKASEQRITEYNQRLEQYKQQYTAILQNEQSRANEVKTQLEQTRESLHSEQLRLSNAQNALNVSTQTVENLRTTISSTESQLRAKESEVVTLRQSSEALRVELSKTQTNIDLYKSQYEQLRAISEENTRRYQETLRKLQEELQENKQLSRDLEVKLESAQANLQRTTETFNEQQRALTDKMQERIDRLTSEKEKHERRLQKVHDDRARLQQQQDLLQAEINQKNDRLRQLEQDAAELRGNLERARSRKKDLEDVEAVSREQEERNARLAIEAQRVNAMFDDLKRESREFFDKMKKRKGKITELRQELEAFINQQKNASPPSSSSSSSSAPPQIVYLPAPRQPEYTPQELGLHLQSKGILPAVQQDTPVIEFDITAERERHRHVIDQLIVLDNGRAYDAMEDYILQSGDVNPAVFVVLDKLSLFVNMVEGFTNTKHRAFFISTNKPGKGIIRDVIEAASSEVEHSHVLDIMDFQSMRDPVKSIIERALRGKELDSLARNPGDLFTEIVDHPPVETSSATVEDSLERSRSAASSSSIVNDDDDAIEYLFNAHEQLKEDHDFFEFLQAHVLPALDQPDKGVFFSLAHPTDNWSVMRKGASLHQVAEQLSVNLVQHLHVRELRRQRRRPTRLSVRKLLSDYLISNTLGDVHHAGILYQSTNDKITGILASVLHSGFLSAFTYCLGALNIPMEFDSPRLYAAIQNSHFVALVGLRYNAQTAMSQVSRSQLAITAIQAAFSNKLDFLLLPSNRITPITIPLDATIFSNAPRSRLEYIQRVERSEEATYEQQRRRLRRLTSSRRTIF